MSMHILVTWWSGMLWSTFKSTQVLEKLWHIVWYTDHRDCDIGDYIQVSRILDKHKIDIVINCAAYTDVETAEDEGMLINYQVNAIWSIVLAKSTDERKIKMIHLSTDYVFSGGQREWYSIQDIPDPINNYGMAKYIAEKTLLWLFPMTKIIRTSRLYGWWSQYKNFVNTMLKLSEQKSEILVIDDQWGSPTYTGDLVTAISNIIDQWEKTDRLLHFCNQTWWSGISRYDFAKEIFVYTNKKTIIKPICSSSYPTKADRPSYSLLLNDSWIQLPNRKESLHWYIDSIL